MKTLLTLCIAAVAIAICSPLLAQSPAAPTATITPSATVSASPAGDLADKIHQRFEKKFGRHHGIVIDGDESDEGHSPDIPGQVFPIVGITMITLFGAPVMIVAVIMFMSYLKARSLHRTVQRMVEKGQPVPAALLASPVLPRPRSDMRRGIILVMIGVGLMLFCAAASDWEGGAWAVGIIPFLIGLGYLLVWKLEGKKNVSSPPPLP